MGKEQLRHLGQPVLDLILFYCFAISFCFLLYQSNQTPKTNIKQVKLYFYIYLVTLVIQVGMCRFESLGSTPSLVHFSGALMTHSSVIEVIKCHYPHPSPPHHMWCHSVGNASYNHHIIIRIGEWLTGKCLTQVAPPHRQCDGWPVQCSPRISHTCIHTCIDSLKLS